jgi:hypothetical protein
MDWAKTQLTLARDLLRFAVFDVCMRLGVDAFFLVAAHYKRRRSMRVFATEWAALAGCWPAVLYGRAVDIKTVFQSFEQMVVSTGEANFIIARRNTVDLIIGIPPLGGAVPYYLCPL